MDWEKAAGISLALASGFFIGTSLIFQKKGLIDTKARERRSDSGSTHKSKEHAYLQNATWWIGMLLMVLGELSNFLAYAFVPAILVTPLGALSVVVSAVLSNVFLKEKLNFSGKVGCAQCVLGAIIIVLHAPATTTTSTLAEFFTLVFHPIFIAYGSICFVGLVVLILYAGPRWGHRQPMVYISVCSIVGSFLVLAAQGVGSSTVYSVSHWQDDNQLKIWGFYPLLVFVAVTAVMQVHFLNRALGQFTAAVVTPVYYVSFSTATMVSSAILYQGFPVGSALNAISIVAGFLTIVLGVALLFQYSVKLRRLAVKGDARHHHTPSFAAAQVQATLESTHDRLDLSMSLSRDALLRRASERTVAPTSAVSEAPSLWQSVLKSEHTRSISTQGAQNGQASSSRVIPENHGLNIMPTWLYQKTEGPPPGKPLASVAAPEEARSKKTFGWLSTSSHKEVLHTRSMDDEKQQPMVQINPTPAWFSGRNHKNAVVNAVFKHSNGDAAKQRLQGNDNDSIQVEDEDEIDEDDD
ncbi:hypothetical protein SmJEL517_g00433 [Synchytrium microbalum]|uniref:Magnesium transporter NIPA n=1 Tax=Synchytrium microbalum TaxID=1806994 RepID=A0A507CDC8_9FUNG|nr:uncharacterized protein SmJEL517_g00433 [Synchytrium microbalum]TPX37622.1 hypothetical protein SmJEL517_g00433 [Synchytrium microbalum]